MVSELRAFLGSLHNYSFWVILLLVGVALKCILEVRRGTVGLLLEGIAEGRCDFSGPWVEDSSRDNCIGFFGLTRQ